MDEILLANFMVFHDLAREEDYDLWVGDESWELDYYLHENPEQKHAAYAWFTDFVGWLPMPDGGPREAFLTADYHVRHRLDRYRAGRCMDYQSAGPADIAAIAAEIGRPVDYLPVATGAASLLASLL
jgi:hypothetical protein